MCSFVGEVSVGQSESAHVDIGQNGHCTRNKAPDRHHLLPTAATTPAVTAINASASTANGMGAKKADVRQRQVMADTFGDEHRKNRKSTEKETMMLFAYECVCMVRKCGQRTRGNL